MDGASTASVRNLCQYLTPQQSNRASKTHGNIKYNLPNPPEILKHLLLGAKTYYMSTQEQMCFLHNVSTIPWQSSCLGSSITLMEIAITTANNLNDEKQQIANHIAEMIHVIITYTFTTLNYQMFNS